MQTIETVASQLGVQSLRSEQRQMIESALHGEHCLGIFPTGWGKSLVYQIPALLGHGTTIIFSPLISLMDDQTQSLNRMGIPGVKALHSRVRNPDVQRMVLQEFHEGKIKLLYCAPERIQHTRQNLFDYVDGVTIDHIVIDEVHCWTNWQETFRPEYTHIPALIDRCKPKSVMAMTATAGRFTRDQIKQDLGLPMAEFVAETIDRPNLIYHTMPRSEQALYAWVRAHRQRPGIIFCRSVAAVKYLSQRLGCASYHGQMKPADRLINQERFMSKQSSVMVATNAFGMGVNKADIRWIVHFDIPTSLDDLIQETGRAGRDGLPSDCLTMVPSSFRLQRYLIEMQNPSFETIKAVYDDLAERGADTFWRRPSNLPSISHDQIESAIGYLKFLGIAQSQHDKADAFELQILKEGPKVKRGPFAVLSACQIVGGRLSAIREQTGMSRKAVLAGLRVLKNQQYIKYEPPVESIVYRLIKAFEVDPQRVRQKASLAWNNFRIMLGFLQQADNAARHRYIQDYLDCDHDQITPDGYCLRCRFLLYPAQFHPARAAMEEFRSKQVWVDSHFR